MTLDRFYKLCQFACYVAIIVVALYCMNVAVNGQGTYYPRFHRYAITDLDRVTTLDIVKDMESGKCRLFYRVREHTAVGITHAVTYAGEVACNPIPVPPKVGDAPPASVVR